MLSVRNKRALQRTHVHTFRSQSLLLHRLSTHNSGTNTINVHRVLHLLIVCLPVSPCASHRHHVVPKCVARRRPTPQCSQAYVHVFLSLSLSVSVSSICLSLLSICLLVCLSVSFCRAIYRRSAPRRSVWRWLR